jgi:hypothetical protein
MIRNRQLADANQWFKKRLLAADRKSAHTRTRRCVLPIRAGRGLIETQI